MRVEITTNVLDAGGTPYKAGSIVDTEPLDSGPLYVKGSRNLLLCSHEWKPYIDEDELMALLEEE